jgi:hypothetical protein
VLGWGSARVGANLSEHSWPPLPSSSERRSEYVIYPSAETSASLSHRLSRSKKRAKPNDCWPGPHAGLIN